MMKDPLTLVANQTLLWELKPRTVIEFGAYKGGSALWTADVLKMFECKSRVVSIDIDLSMLDPVARESPDVEFLEGDLFQMEKCFPGDFLKVNLKSLNLVLRINHISGGGRMRDPWKRGCLFFLCLPFTSCNFAHPNLNASANRKWISIRRCSLSTQKVIAVDYWLI